MPNELEAQLVARCLNGATDAWDELFTQHYDPTARYVFQLSGGFTREDAEEIVQETFLAVVRSLKEFHGDCLLRTWIFRIAGNKARDYLEKRQAAKRGGGQADIPLDAAHPETGLPLDLPAPLPPPDRQLEQAERASLVTEALAQLELPCREVIELRYFGDLSYDEIGAEIGLTAKTVSSRLSRCLDRLEEVARQLFSRKDSPANPV